jgi:hypothetical protein
LLYHHAAEAWGILCLSPMAGGWAGGSEEKELI